MSKTFFDDLAAKYRCCCGCMHVKSGTIIFCLLFLASNAYDAVDHFSKGDQSIWKLIRIIVGFPIFLGPLIGIKKCKPAFFLPFLGITVIDMIYFLVLIIFSIIGCFPQTSLGKEIQDLFKKYCHCDPSDVDLLNAFLSLIAMGTLLLLFEIWVFSVIYKCYKYISDKSEQILPKFIVPSVEIISKYF